MEILTNVIIAFQAEIEGIRRDSVHNSGMIGCWKSKRDAAFLVGRIVIGHTARREAIRAWLRGTGGTKAREFQVQGRFQKNDGTVAFWQHDGPVLIESGLR